MIAIETRQLAGGVTYYAAFRKENAPCLPVVFYHGFTSSSTVYSYFARCPRHGQDSGSHAGCAGAWRSLRRRLTGTDTPILAILRKTYGILRRYVRRFRRKIGYLTGG